MDWERWVPWMDRIRKDFGYSEADDRAAARELDAIVRGMEAPPIVDFAHRLVSDASVAVLGVADSALLDLESADRRDVLIACDGATTAAREADRVPDVVVTDLDGRVEDQIWAAEQGAFVFIHAHGDNRDRLQTWVPRFPSNVLGGTCQVRAFGSLVNPGGFTDGDRACFLAHGLSARRVRLLGFDLEGPVGKYSGDHDPATKRRKLAWCARLLKLVQSEGLEFEPPLVSSSTQRA